MTMRPKRACLFYGLGCGFSPAHLNQKAEQNVQPTALNLYFFVAVDLAQSNALNCLIRSQKAKFG